MPLDDIQHLAALEDCPVIRAILLGQPAGEEVEVSLALDLFQGGSQLGAEAAVGQNESSLQVLGEHHLGG
jgi:hypothetical protein